MFKIRHLLPLAALAAVLGYAVPSSAETIIDEWATVKTPSPPELKSVTLDPKTTAILVLDMLKQTCNEQRRPRCVTAYVDKFMLGDKDTGLQKILKDKGSRPSFRLVPRRIMASSSRQSWPHRVALTWPCQ